MRSFPVKRPIKITLRQSILKTNILNSDENNKKPTSLQQYEKNELTTNDNLSSTKSSCKNKTYSIMLSPPTSPSLKIKQPGRNSSKNRVSFRLEDTVTQVRRPTLPLSTQGSKRVIHFSNSGYASPQKRFKINKSNSRQNFSAKKLDPFEISAEDQMFNEYKNKKPKIFFKNPLLNQKKKNNKFDANQKILETEVYKTKPNFSKDLSSVRHQKNRYNLLGYHNKLVNLIRNEYSQESVNRLNRTFSQFRTKWSIKTSKSKDDAHKSNRQYLQEIEKEEESIINRINKRTYLFGLYLKRNLKCISQKNQRNFECNFPNLKFIKVANKKAKNYWV